MKLSKNFSLHEFLISSKYPELLRDVELSDEQIDKLYYLCMFGLQPIRDEFGYIQITSGFRTKILNFRLKGVENSQHLRAEAADFVCPDAKDYQIFRFLTDYCGEVGWYKDEHRFHLSLPQRGVKMDHYIKGGK